MHPLLKRQIRKTFGPGHQPTPECESLLEVINRAYEQADEDRRLLERSLEVTSEELTERYELLKERSAERETISGAIWLMLSSSSTQAIYRLFPKFLSRQFECAYVAVELLEPKSNCMIPVAWERPDKAGPETGLAPLDDSVSGLVFRTGKALLNPDLEKLGNVFQRRDYATLACAPLRFRNESLGAVTVADLSPRRITPLRLETLQVVSRELAQTIKHLWNEEDRRRLETQMQAAQRLESLGVLAGGIAHDFNNLLVGILGNAGLALNELPRGSNASELIQQVKVSATRAADLTHQLLAYAGKASFKIRAVDLTDLVGEIVSLLRSVVSKKATFKLDLGEDLPTVAGDPGQLHQVIMNLVTNASDALKDTPGDILIRTVACSVVDERPEEGFVAGQMRPGEFVMLEVTDTGAGIETDNISRIFDPFFTTKFQGRGLGLAAVLGIVRGHKAFMKVESKPDRGTTFRIYFPVHVKNYIKPATESGAESGGGTLLVADDEGMVLKVVQRTLENAGYRVLTARDGVEAVERFRESGGRIDAVVLDMTMPRMDGRQALEEIRKIDPAARVLLTSGFTAESTQLDSADDPLIGFIQKPYMPDDLIRKVKTLLGTKA